MHNYVKAKRVPNNIVLEGETTAAFDATSASPSAHTRTLTPVFTWSRILTPTTLNAHTRTLLCV